MMDITHKRPTLRVAVAQAKVFCGAEAIDAIDRGAVPKGDALEISRAVGLLAVKRTPDLLPFCHPIEIDGAEILLAVERDGIRIEVEAQAIARTGVEVEAMTAASLAALNLYDMLKPIDDQVTIGEIRLVRKRGGKNDFGDEFAEPPVAGVLVCSDAVAAGDKEDKAGKLTSERLTAEGLRVGLYEVVPDEPEKIAHHVETWSDSEEFDLVVTVGGTGLGPRDRTIEALRPLLEREIPGVAEAMRSFGMERTPYAALSRSIAGHIGRTLVITLPGSTSGASESLDALFPWVTHLLKVFDRAYRHGR